jgi:hypothetical protein
LPSSIRPPPWAAQNPPRPGESPLLCTIRRFPQNLQPLEVDRRLLLLLRTITHTMGPIPKTPAMKPPSRRSSLSCSPS